ncbi:hypothetical protein, partial [Terrisporobacter glycolicus]|uniref:hypothetical protein n=1 Tax=Terrisporobacter glycolicus TaxID=36841 RepID=UPI003464B313
DGFVRRYDMVLKFLRRCAFFSTVFGSLLLILFLSVTNFSILPFIQDNMGSVGKIMYSYIIQNELEYTANSAIIIAGYNILLYLLSSCPKFDFSAQNPNFKSDSTELPAVNSTYSQHVAKSFYFHIKVDYRNILSYWIYHLCGGVSMEITYPQWIDATEASFWNTSQFIDNNNGGVILIDIYKAFPKSKLKKYAGEIYCKFDLITNLNMTSYDEGFIDVSLKPNSQNIIKKIFANIFILFFYDLSYNRHEIKIASN